MTKGKIIIISAPSGSGKSTIINDLLSHNATLAFSVSATSRKPRTGEVDGINYYFFTPEEFRKEIKDNAFLEYEEVYADTYYGTLKREVERLRNEGKNVILDIDVKGGINMKKYFGDDSISIYIKPPSIEELRNRLIHRNTDSIEAIEQRVAKAEYELSFANQYDIIIVNDILENAIVNTNNAIIEFTNK